MEFNKHLKYHQPYSGKRLKAESQLSRWSTPVCCLPEIQAMADLISYSSHVVGRRLV